MPDIWETAFTEKQLIWGVEPTASALITAEQFATRGAKEVLIPGTGYGRNAKAFLAKGMSVTGIEVSETAIGLARSALGLEFPIHHGSVELMPFDDGVYDGIFCYGLLYLLDGDARHKLIRDCHLQLAPGGEMVFTLISKKAPMYGRGRQLGVDWFEPHGPGITMYFYDAASIERDFGPYGLVDAVDIGEPSHGGTLPFINVTCRSPADAKKPG